MNWIKIKDRMPPFGKLVYTKNDKGYVAAFTLYEHGWNTKLSDDNSQDNSPIVEWLDEPRETLTEKQIDEEARMFARNYDYTAANLMGHGNFKYLADGYKAAMIKYANSLNNTLLDKILRDLQPASAQLWDEEQFEKKAANNPK